MLAAIPMTRDTTVRGIIEPFKNGSMSWEFVQSAKGSRCSWQLCLSGQCRREQHLNHSWEMEGVLHLIFFHGAFYQYRQLSVGIRSQSGVDYTLGVVTTFDIHWQRTDLCGTVRNGPPTSSKDVLFCYVSKSRCC